MAVEPHDYQRSRVYLWEDSLPLTVAARKKKLSISRCQEIADEACRIYGVQRVIVMGPRSRIQKCAYYRPETHTISLPDWARVMSALLHELAHAIAEDKFGVSSAGHTERFVGVYMYLLEKFDRFGIDKSQEWADDYGVMYDTTIRCAPPGYAIINKAREKSMNIDARIALLEAELAKLQAKKLVVTKKQQQLIPQRVAV